MLKYTYQVCILRLIILKLLPLSDGLHTRGMLDKRLINILVNSIKNLKSSVIIGTEFEMKTVIGNFCKFMHVNLL